MVQSTSVIRIQQVAKIVQRAIGMLFLTEASRLFGNAFISVTMVNISSDLSLARVYLSFSLHDDQERLLQEINDNKNTIRRLLGKMVAGKIRKVPNLKFIVDHSVMQGARVTALMDQLGLREV